MISFQNWALLACYLFCSAGLAQVLNENMERDPPLVKLSHDNGLLIDLAASEATDKGNSWEEAWGLPVLPYQLLKRSEGGWRVRGKKQKESDFPDLPFWAARGKKARSPYLNAFSSPPRGKKDSEEELMNGFWAARGKRTGSGATLDVVPFWAARGKKANRPNDYADNLANFPSRDKRYSDPNKNQQRVGSRMSRTEFDPYFWAARGKKSGPMDDQ